VIARVTQAFSPEVHGVLTVRVPKAAQARSRRVEIKE
jgi:hypothetical protein